MSPLQYPDTHPQAGWGRAMSPREKCRAPPATYTPLLLLLVRKPASALLLLLSPFFLCHLLPSANDVCGFVSFSQQDNLTARDCGAGVASTMTCSCSN